MMTFEEFKALAEHPSYQEAPAVYKLEAYGYSAKSEYPTYLCQILRCSIHFTKEEAEQCMRDAYNRAAQEELLPHHATIERYLVGIHLIGGSEDKTWTYDEKGQVYAESWTPLPPREMRVLPFRGRPDDKIPFHKGEFVELLNYSEAFLGIIVNDGISIANEWEFYNRQWDRDRKRPGWNEEEAMNYPYHDSVDDCYYCYTADNEPNEVDDDPHEHQPPMYICHTHLPVPEGLKQRLLKRYNEYWQIKD
jgi:hypothetical protein